MHRNIAILTAMVLVLTLSLAACGQKPAEGSQPVTTQPGITQPGATGTASTTVPGESLPEDSTGTGTSTQPTLDYGTDVGSGRVEGDGNSQTETTKPTTQTEKPTTPAPDDGLNMDYRQYMAMSSQEQQLFFDKHFSNDPLGFATWFQKIKQEYDDETPEIIATGPIDIGDYINP